MAEALKGIVFGLLEAVNSGAWQDDGTGFATATLIAAGVAPDRAAEVVRAVKEAA